MRIYSKNNPAKFHPDPIRNDGVKNVTPNKNKKMSGAIWDRFLIQNNDSSTKKEKQTSCGAKAQQTPSPCCACIARFLGIDQKCNQASHGHSTPSLKISCKSVQPFSRNLANKETKKERYKQTKKEIDRKQ